MADMLVNLGALPNLALVLDEQMRKGVKIRRGQANEKDKIVEWVRENINPSWVIGCETALEQEPSTCYIAVEMNEAQIDDSNDLPSELILGFACFDVVTNGVFGPTGVLEERQDSGIDTALLLTCLHEMAALDYGRAVIGWTAFIDRNSRASWSDNR
jgi:hypothetical protein